MIVGVCYKVIERQLNSLKIEVKSVCGIRKMIIFAAKPQC